MAVHGCSTFHGTSSLESHCALQFAVEGGKTAVPVGVWATGIVFGSLMVTLSVKCGSFPGRPEGECVYSLMFG